MLRLLLALLVTALTACDPDFRTDGCQQACDISHGPGLIGVMCQTERGRCTPLPDPGYRGDCACTTDGVCGAGGEPWEPHPAPPAADCP